MELKDNLSAESSGLPYGKDIDEAASRIKNTATTLFKGIRLNAKTKFAQKTSDQGQYWTLRPYLKNLIEIPQYILDQVKGQGITYYAVLQLPEQNVGANNSDIIRALQNISGKGDILKADPTSQAAKVEAQYVIGDEANASQTIGTLPSPTQSAVKQYLPYVIGVAIAAIILYLIIHKK